MRLPPAVVHQKKPARGRAQFETVLGIVRRKRGAGVHAGGFGRRPAACLQPAVGPRRETRRQPAAGDGCATRSVFSRPPVKIPAIFFVTRSGFGLKIGLRTRRRGRDIDFSCIEIMSVRLASAVLGRSLGNGSGCLYSHVSHLPGNAATSRLECADTSALWNWETCLPVGKRRHVAALQTGQFCRVWAENGFFRGFLGRPAQNPTNCGVWRIGFCRIQFFQESRGLDSSASGFFRSLADWIPQNPGSGGAGGGGFHRIQTFRESCGLDSTASRFFGSLAAWIPPHPDFLGVFWGGFRCIQVFQESSGPDSVAAGFFKSHWDGVTASCVSPPFHKNNNSQPTK